MLCATISLIIDCYFATGTLVFRGVCGFSSYEAMLLSVTPLVHNTPWCPHKSFVNASAAGQLTTCLPHVCLQATAYPQHKYPNPWFGLHDPQAWSARSPHFVPRDCLLTVGAHNNYKKWICHGESGRPLTAFAGSE